MGPESYANFESEVFNCDARMKALMASRIGEEFDFSGGSAQAFMIWDRFLHLIGNPNHNRNDHTRDVHLEGITDCLKIIVAALNLLPIAPAKLLKAELAAKKRKALHPHEAPKKHSSIGSGVSAPKVKSYAVEYGLSFSLIQSELNNHDFIAQIEEPSVRKLFPLPPRQVLPQGDTLAYIFCPYLFDTCFDVIRGKISSQISRSQEFETAFGGLCHVLLTMTSASFNEDVLGHYYDIIKSSFDSSKVSQKIRAVVVGCCARHCLFGNAKMTGVNILIPEFMSLICSKFGINDSSTLSSLRSDVKLEAPVVNEDESVHLLDICCTLVCFASHFADTSVRQTPYSTSSPASPSRKGSIARELFALKEMKNIILMVFTAVSNVEDARREAVQLSIWGLTTLVFDEVTSTRNSDFLRTAARALVACTSVRSLNFAPYATGSVEMLSVLCVELISIDEELVKKTILGAYVKNLSEFVELCTSGESVSRHRTVANVGADMIYSLSEWVFQFPPKFLADPSLMSSIFKCLLKLLQHAEKVSLTLEAINSNYLAKLVFAAKSVTLVLFNYLCSFPVKHDTGAIHTNAVERPKDGSSSAAASESLLKSHIFGVYQNSCLLSCCDEAIHHFDRIAHGVRILSRDDSGKFLWKCTPCTFVPTPPHYSTLPTTAAQRYSVQKSPIASSGTGAALVPTGVAGRPHSLSTVRETADPSATSMTGSGAPIGDVTSADIARIQSGAKDRVSSVVLSHMSEGILAKPEFTVEFDNDDSLAHVLGWVEENLGGIRATPEPPAPSMTDSVRAAATTSPSKPSPRLKKKKSTLSEALADSATAVGSLPDGMLTGALAKKMREDIDMFADGESSLRSFVEKSRSESDADGRVACSPSSPTSSIAMATSRTSPTHSLSHSAGEVRKFSVGVEDDPLLDFEDEMRRKAFSPFDATRALLCNFGLLTPGPVLNLEGESCLSSFKALQAAGIPIVEYRKARKAPERGGGGGRTTSTAATSPASAREMKTRTRSDADLEKVSALNWGKLAAYFSMVDSSSLSVLQGKYAALERRVVPLDQSSFPREKHKIGVVYVCDEQENQREILKNTGGTPAYEKFCNDLGTLVDLTMHEGFKGGLGSDTTGRFATYYSTISYELVFHMPTRMPTRLEDPQQTEKKRHVGNDHVNVIWTEHYREYLCATISTSFNNVHVVVYPLPCGLYRVRVHKKAGVPYFGPLVDNMLVREALLPTLVRLTTLEANRAVRYATPGYTKPFVERRKYIDEAMGKLFTKDSGTLLSTFFPALPTE